MVLSILQLPNEILANIISRVLNGDLENFTLACKRLHALASRPLRAHRARQHSLKRISLGVPRWLSEGPAWRYPTSMLLDLLRGDLFYYPWALTIDSLAWESDGLYEGLHKLDSVPYYETDTGINFGVDRSLTTFAEDIKPLLKACPYFDEDEDLSRAVLEKDVGATLGLLLNILPNLRALYITGFTEGDTGSLKRIFESMLTSSQNPAREPAPFFGKLESVIFVGRRQWNQGGDSLDLSTYAPLLYFPSVRYLHIHRLDVSDDSWTYPGVLSHITRLEIVRSTISVEALKSFLKTTQNLQHFEYYDNTWHGPLRSRIKEITQTVLEQVGHGLRYLEILCLHEGELGRAGAFSMGSLKAFRVLETIKISGSTLVEPVETRDRIYSDPATARSGQTRRLTDILPSSVVRVTIVSEIGVTDRYEIGGDVVMMLRGLPENKADLLPNLEVVVFAFNNDYCSIRHSTMITVQSEILRACKQVGIKILTDVELTGEKLSIKFG